MWNRVLTWLGSAPIADEVDRRNAPVMQLLLLFYGIALPANWAWHLSSRPIPKGWTIVLILDLITASLALFSVFLIRRGKFRIAIKLFVAAQLASLTLAYHMLGAQAQLIDQVSVIMVLVISGLVLGRRALWTAFCLLVVVFAIGFVTDANNSQQSAQWIANSLRNAPSLVLSYLIITIILDRTLTALRESLAESKGRQRELQREMAERERAQAQLIHAQKLEATGRRASGVAHDFNNILDVILGFSSQRHRLQELSDERERTDGLADALDGVEVAARRGTALSRKLLSFSRRDLLKLETFDLSAALAELQPMLRQLFPPKVRLQYAASEEPLPVRMDRSELELMVLNIAANARDAMPEGGHFTATVSQSGGHAEIAMADDGQGMDDLVKRQIFEPFFTTKSAADGTGLGLSVIRDLIAAAGGDIRIESELGKGSTFYLRLPLAAADTGANR